MVPASQAQRDANAGLDLLWGTRERPSRGPKPSLSLEEIARAGMAIADAEGLGALSMRRIAEDLGFTPMSLYRYVPGKTELLAVMIDAAIGDASPIDETSGSWRSRLVAWAGETLAILRRHPWLVYSDSPDSLTGPNKIAWIEAGLRTIANTGLSGGDMLETLLAVYRYVQGGAQLLHLWEQEEPTSWTTSSPLMQRIAADDRFPIFGAVLAEGELDQPEFAETPDASYSESFAFGLERLLDGIEALIRDRAVAADRSDAGSPD